MSAPTRAWLSVAAVVAAVVLVIGASRLVGGTEPSPTDSTAASQEEPSPTDSTAASQEIDDEAPAAPDPDIAGAPGEVVQTGHTTDPTPIDPPPETEPGWDPVDLDPVEPSGDEFFVDPDPVPVDTVPGTIGDLTSNAPGCASNCIIKAILTPELLSADLAFELETNVATTARIWMTTGQVFWINDVPLVDGLDPLGEKNVASHEWETELEPLEFSTTYQVILEVTDQFGNTVYRSTEYTTVDPPTPGQLVGNGGGCYYQCIVWGEVTPTFDYDTVILTVQTTVPVEFEIAVSTDPVGFIGESPLLNADEELVVDELEDAYIRARITGLEPDTTYNVLLRVTDEDGFESHAIGDFHTDPVPPEPPQPTNVFMRLERVTVIEDGDPGGRGEIKFVWGFESGSYFATREWDKISSGTTITLPPDAGTWVTIPFGGDLPNFVVNVVESDYDPQICPLSDTPLVLAAGEIGCGLRSNVAMIGTLPLTWLEDMDVCSSFFTVPFGQDRPCLQISSQDLGNAWPHFTAIISFATE